MVIADLAQAGLAAEVVDHKGGAHSGLRCHGTYRGAGESLTAEQAYGCIPDPCPGGQIFCG